MDFSVNPNDLTVYKNLSSLPSYTGNFEATTNATDSIFASSDVQTVNANELETLKAELEEVKNEQGAIGKLWSGFKNATGLGLSLKEVEQEVEKFEKGEISFEEAYETVQSFSQKQKGMVDLAANVASGLVVAGSAIVTGGTSLLAGAAIGGAVKAGIKTADRATNNIEGDALDAKQIIKDGVTGAVDGAVTVATAGMVKGPIIGQSIGKAVTTGVVQGAKAGVISGAASSATSYTIDAALEEDVKFNLKDLAKTTAQGAAVGGAFGGVLGGVTGGVAQAKLNSPAVVELADNLHMEAGNIKDSEALTNYLAKNRKLDVDDLNQYIKSVDLDEVAKIAPQVKDYNPEQLMSFYDVHYNSGTTTFDASTLSLPKDLTEYLKNNYVSADQLDDLMAAYPTTNRHVGEMPTGWLDNISSPNQLAAQEEIYEAIAKFQSSGNKADLADDLTAILGKDVNVEELGSGMFGTGYKISMDGADDTCLKIFNQGDTTEAFINQRINDFGLKGKAADKFRAKNTSKIYNAHGQNAEVQAGLFANEHSDDFVKMYFGQVAGANNTDGFLLTQFLDDGITPVSTGAKSGGYIIKSGDAFKKDSFLGKAFMLTSDKNMKNGKIIDFGAIKVKRAPFSRGA